MSDPSRDSGAGPRLDPFARPLDRAVMTLRREFGHDAAIAKIGDEFRVEHVIAYCPLHPAPDVFALELREPGGHGGRLHLECRNGCLPSAVLDELRRLERWHAVLAVAPEQAE